MLRQRRQMAALYFFIRAFRRPRGVLSRLRPSFIVDIIPGNAYDNDGFTPPDSFRRSESGEMKGG